MRVRWMVTAVAVATLGVAGCGAGGGSDAEDATTTTKAKETTTTEAANIDAGAFQVLFEDANDAIVAETEARNAFADESDLDGAIESSTELRSDLYTFDGAVRELDLEDEQELVNELLTASGTYIEVLDGFVEVTDISGYNEQFDAETEARIAFYDAGNALAEALDQEGVPNELDEPSDDEEDTGDDPETLAEEIPAGEVVNDGSFALEVPEGFTATVGAVIEMTHEGGATLGIYNVQPQGGADDLESVAAASSAGAVEKNDYEVIGEGEELEVGDLPAIGYAYDDGFGNTLIDVYFQAEDATGEEWHVISVTVPEDQVDEVMDAVEAVMPTFEVVA